MGQPPEGWTWQDEQAARKRERRATWFKFGAAMLAVWGILAALGAGDRDADGGTGGQDRSGLFDETQDSGMIVACSRHLGNGAWGADMNQSNVTPLGGAFYTVDVYDDSGSFVGSCEVESDDAEDVYRVR